MRLLLVAVVVVQLAHLLQSTGVGGHQTQELLVHIGGGFAVAFEFEEVGHLVDDGREKG